MCNAFPSLLDLEVHKDAMVADVWDGKRELRGWTLHFSKLFSNWEVEEVERFLQVLHNKKVLPSQEDRLLLKEAKVTFVFLLNIE